ncbi:MAG: ABC transporter substrate-binding protein [Nanoarchaeota archaeon]|nr:ABC transporter substrate-binding protein [Nanoarchaeota archaeon]
MGNKEQNKNKELRIIGLIFPKKTMLFILLVLLLSLLLLTLSGCVNNSDPTIKKRTGIEETQQQPEHKVNWIGHWFTEHDRETLVREVKSDFEMMNPDIEANLKFPSQIMGFRSKPEEAKLIADMIRTGNIEWDVVWIDTMIYQYVAEKLNDSQWGEKYLVNFEDVPSFKETQKSFIINDPIYKKQTGDIIVGPYIEGTYYLIGYNQDVAKKMGIEIKQYGMTFDDLLSYVKQVYEYNQEHNTNVAAFYESKDRTTLEMLFQSLVKSELKDFDIAKKEIGSEEKNAAVLKTFQAFEEMGKYNPLIDSYKENIWFQTRHLVLNDECLFYVCGTWGYSHWMGIDERKIKKMVPAELPVFNKVNYYLGTFVPTWAVMKDSPNKEEAIKLLMFWSRPPVAEKWVRYAKAPTGLVGQISIPGTADDQFDQFLAKITDKHGSNVHYSANAGYILGEENRLLQKDINEKLIQLLTGEITAQQAYDDIMAKVK